MIEIPERGTPRIILYFLLVFSGLAFALRTAGLPWWGTLVASVWACLPITNALLLGLTSMQSPLAAFSEASRLDPSLPQRIEEFGRTTSWGEEQDRQFEELRPLADSRLAFSAIYPVEQLKTMLTIGTSKRSFWSSGIIFLLFWKVPPPEPVASDIREELLAIASDLRMVEAENAQARDR